MPSRKGKFDPWTSLNQHFQNLKIGLEGQFGLFKKEIKVEEESTHSETLQPFLSVYLVWYSAITVHYMRLGPGRTILTLKL